MSIGQSEHEEKHVAGIVSVNPPNTPYENEATPEQPIRLTDEPAPQFPYPPRSRWRRAPVGVALGAFLVAVTLLTILTDAGGTTARSAKVRSTVTPLPTVTSTATPSPTPMVGFQLYVDDCQCFLVQYPLGWVKYPASPGIEFVDDRTSPLYMMQVVMVPSDAAPAGATSTPGDATPWINYEMNTLSQSSLLWQGNFERVPNSTTTVRFGNATWQTGAALLSGDQARMRVQIYATVHDGTPFVINLFAPDDQFSAAMAHLYTPMLNSFQFIPQAG